MSAYVISRPRRNGKTTRVRARVFGFVAVGDLVTVSAGKDAARYRIIEKKRGPRAGIEDGPYLLVIRENDEQPCKIWEIDPATVRTVFEGNQA